MRFLKSLPLCLGLGLFAAGLPLTAQAGSTTSYKVELNKTEIVRLPGAASAVIIGNPKIADVTVQSSDLIFVVGRGYGETNLIILDSNGNTMMNADLQVVNTLPQHGVRLYNGSSRQTYSCIPYCGQINLILMRNPLGIPSILKISRRHLIKFDHKIYGLLTRILGPLLRSAPYYLPQTVFSACLGLRFMRLVTMSDEQAEWDR